MQTGQSLVLALCGLAVSPACNPGPWLPRLSLQATLGRARLADGGAHRLRVRGGVSLGWSLDRGQDTSRDSDAPTMSRAVESRLQGPSCVPQRLCAWELDARTEALQALGVSP